MTTFHQPTEYELAALRAFAAKHGRRWKVALRASLGTCRRCGTTRRLGRLGSMRSGSRRTAL
jgi:hypothetical protein